ncbi:dihydrofolate reductase family protein [Kribbella italica]|uniref:Dihydrofolate reductase n=1 Tax=Kribbella italica TaxID=1540520 RepID=A0A7W9JE41_9ACTN|nr:dihydrofolate reductase family protein [Kribbella italica]MBB5840471.1 dihydrofolate reductase [Kribbella italica]
MAKISVVNFQSLDGVVQSVLSADEDREGGFAHGGWVSAGMDEAVAEFMQGATLAAGGLLLGRKTYETFAATWAPADQSEPAVAAMNRIPKYVASRTLTSGSWNNTVVLGPDLVSAVREIPEELVVFGSAELLRTLLAHGVVDELHLLTFPLVLGSGKKMFGELSSPLPLQLEVSRTTPSGVTISSYSVG